MHDMAIKWPDCLSRSLRHQLKNSLAIIGKASGISQQNAKPYRAPAREHVSIVVGSSLAAPLIRPGPRTSSSRGLLGPTTGPSLLKVHDLLVRFGPVRAVD